MNKTITTIIVILIIILGAVLIYRNNAKNSMETPGEIQQEQSQVPVTPANTPAAVSGSPTTAVKEFTVAGNNFKFMPATITVNKGDRVRITFQNTGGFHDFVIDEFNVATERINGNAQEVVEFTADKAGSFEYYCSVGTHRQMGMKGTLIVK
jgi:plastocyanin